MPNESVAQLLEYKYKPKVSGYTGPTKYRVGEKEYDVAPWNHPATLAISILNWIVHTFFYGVYIVAPMGHGKTTIAQSIVHHIHLKDPRYKVIWAGEHEFTHQEQFFSSLPKQPVVIVFDDISGVLKQLSEKQIEANFSSLTRVRWILDPVNGSIPVICIVVGHYSKNLEKEFRAQLGMSIYAAFGNEERTNLDTIAQKGTDAYNTLNHFGNLYSGMFEKHCFKLPLGNGHMVEYKTDNPFRCVAAISKTSGKIVLYSKHDVCDVCVKKKLHRLVPAKFVYEKIKAAYDNQGINALKIYLYKHGYPMALHPTVATASNFIEQKIAPIYDFDHNEMVQLVWTESKKKMPKRLYNKHKLNNEIISELDKVAVISEQPTNIIINPIQKTESLSSNDMFLK